MENLFVLENGQSQKDVGKNLRRMKTKLTFIISLLIPLLTASQPQPAKFNYLPSYTSQDQIISHTAYTLNYSEPHEQAEWVAYKLTAERVKGTYKRTNNFRPDPTVKTGSAELSDYRKSGYDRGHLAPARSMKWSKTAMSESFYMSNINPQKPGFNRGIWKRLEEQVRTWATDNKEIYIVTGPVLEDNLPTIGGNEVTVPNYHYKVILDYKEPVLKGIGFVLPNEPSRKSLTTYAVTIDSVESLTGIDFFPAMADSVEEVLEAAIEMDQWGLKYSTK